MIGKTMKIISGCQTGADRAALDVALELGLDYGGSIPRGRLAEDGMIDPEKYPRLTELNTDKYIVRTRKNVEDADATLAFTIGPLMGGTMKTIEFAKEYGKPCLHINLKEVPAEEATREIIEWLGKHKPAVLNVAGSRESGSPGIYAKVYDVLNSVFQQMAVRHRQEASTASSPFSCS